MNKTLLWVVGAIVVIGAIVLVMSGRNDSGTQQNNVASNAELNANANASAQANGSKSLAELAASGGAQKCTYSDASGAGTFYVASGKARGDFSSGTGSQKVSGHMILDNNMSYVWNDGQSQGFKISLDSSTQANANANASAQTGVDAQKKMNYSCSSWSADNSMFVMPANVQFMSLGDLQMKQ